MNREQKGLLVEELHKTFAESGGVILLDFKGINVPDITELRRKIRETGSQYQVVKNTLALRAAKDSPVEELGHLFKGPTAIAYTSEDPVALAKLLKDFVQSNPGMGFKAGVLGGRPITAAEVASLAEVPSREQLLSKLAYLLQAPLTRFAAALQSPLRNLASVLSQLAEKKE